MNKTRLTKANSEILLFYSALSLTLGWIDNSISNSKVQSNNLQNNSSPPAAQLEPLYSDAPCMGAPPKPTHHLLSITQEDRPTPSAWLIINPNPPDRILIGNFTFRSRGQK